MVNQQDIQGGRTNVTSVYPRPTHPDSKMLEPEVVNRIRAISGQRLGTKRIARELKISLNTERRYLSNGAAGFQERP
jgi:hypothetical protein